MNQKSSYSDQSKTYGFFGSVWYGVRNGFRLMLGKFGDERASGFRHKLGRKPTLGEVILCTVIIASAIVGLIICW